MSIRYCGICGSGWGPEFNFCPKDGTNLNVLPIATLTPAMLEAILGKAPVASDTLSPLVSESRADSVVAGQRPLTRKPQGTRGFEATVPEMKAPPSEGKPARAPAEVKPSRSEVFELPEIEAPLAKPGRAPAEASLKRAPAEAPKAQAEADPANPDTRGRQRPANRVKSAPEVVRSFKESEEAAPPAPEPAPVHTSKKRRDAAAFSETAWFKRPIADSEIDASTGRVAHTDKTYRPDPSLSNTQRKRFSLRRPDEG